MVVRNPTQFRSSDGVSNQDRPFQFERVNYCQHVLAEAVERVLCGCITGRAPNPRRVIPYTWLWALSFGAKSSNTWAVFPPPARRTIGLPEPPQSRTSNRTSLSTLTNRVTCGDGSFRRWRFVNKEEPREERTKQNPSTDCNGAQGLSTPTSLLRRVACNVPLLLGRLGRLH